MQTYSHVTVGTSSMNRALRFYDAALAPLGLVAWSVTPTEEMYQPFAPRVPAKFIVVTGGELRDPEIRTTEDLAASTFPATSVAA